MVSPTVNLGGRIYENHKLATVHTDVYIVYSGAGFSVPEEDAYTKSSSLLWREHREVQAIGVVFARQPARNPEKHP